MAVQKLRYTDVISLVTAVIHKKGQTVFPLITFVQMLLIVISVPGVAKRASLVLTLTLDAGETNHVS